MNPHAMVHSKTAQVAAALICFLAPLLLLPAAHAGGSGEAWRRSSLAAGTVTSVTAGADSGRVLAVLVSGGFRRSDDGGATWQPANSGLPSRALGAIAVRAVATDPKNDLVAYTSIDLPAGGSTLLRTQDGGRSWSDVGGYAGGGQVHALAVARTADAVYAAAGSRLFVGVSSGSVWAAQGQWPTGEPARALVVDPGDPTRIFVMTQTSVFASADAGRTWRDISPALPAFEPQAMATSIASGSLFVATSSAIHGSRDGGQTWARLPVVAVRSPIHTLLWDAADANVGFLATGDAIYATTNSGRTWRELRQGLDATSIRGLAQAKRGSLYAATTSGVWLSSVSLPPPPTPTQTATATATQTATASATATATATATHTGTATPTASATPTATASPSLTPTAAPPTPTPTKTLAPGQPTETATSTPVPPPTPTNPPATPAPSPTPPPTQPPTATPVPTATPTRPR